MRIFDSRNRLVESVLYDDRSPWPEEADGMGASLERRNPILPSTYPAAWSSSTENGTPGKLNSAFTEQLPPLIMEVDHSPKIPQPNESVTVTARVYETVQRVSAVRLRMGWNRSSFQKIDMVDDGAHGDGEAGDGIYGATVQGGKALDILRFYIEAVDTEGRSSMLPEEGRDSPYLTVVETPVMGERVSIFRVVMEPDVQETFLQRYQTDEYFPATFYDGDTVYYRVHIRHRGRSRIQNGRFKIRFSPDRLFRGAIRRLNFNGTDTGTILQEYLSFQLYQDAGLPNLQTELVRFHINGQTAKGTPYRIAIENPDAQFLQRRQYFERDDGNLYKTTLDNTPNNKATWRYVGDDPSLYRTCYLKQTNEEEDDYGDVIRFCQVLSESEPWDSDYVEKIYSVLNADDFLRWMAVSACVAHWDSPFTDHGQNYVLYDNPGTGQFHVLAWDLNGTFSYSSNTDDINYRKQYTSIRSSKFSAINKILNHPVFGAQYYREIDQLMNTLFSKTSMEKRIDAARDALQLSSGSVSYLKSYVSHRLDDLAKWMDLPKGMAFLSKPVYQVQVGEPYLYRAVAVDYRTNQTFSYRLENSPAWLSIDSKRGILTGTANEEGRFSVTLIAETGSGKTLEQTFSIQATNPQPRLLLPFNEDSGSVTDISEYRQPTILPTTSRLVEGRLGNGVYLNGSDSYIQIPHSDSLSLTGAVTVEAWIKPLSISTGNPVILTKGDENTFNYTLMLGYGPFSWDVMEPCFMPHPFDIENRVYYGRKEIEARLQAQQWIHIAGTYDSAKDLVCVYANNRRIVESANRAWMPENQEPLRIGLSNSRGFRGVVDDIKILPFAKQAFAAGLCLSRIDISGIASAQDRIALSLSGYRHDVISTGDYCIHLVRSDQWYSLPTMKLRPGETALWWLDELGVPDPLKGSETLELYPISCKDRDDETILASMILDQVSWGNDAPGRNDPGVLAGVWLPNRSVALTGTNPFSLSLKNFADNDEYDQDWNVGSQILDGPRISLVIENGMETTSHREVQLQISAADVPVENGWKMRISNHAFFEADWMPLADTLSWILSEGEGENVVYLQVMDAQGNRSPVATDTIYLQDTTRVRVWQIPGF